MNVRKNAKYAVACLSSMGLRITPENRMAVHNSNRFLLQATSASLRTRARETIVGNVDKD